MNPQPASSRWWGRLCPDFTNTVDWHIGPHPREYLTSYADLVAWSQHAHLVEETHAQQLLTATAAHPALAANILQQAITFREALYRLFLATLTQRLPDQADLVTFNCGLMRHPRRLDGVFCKATRRTDGYTSIVRPSARGCVPHPHPPGAR